MKEGKWGEGAIKNTLYYDRRGNWRKDLPERGKITRRTLRDLGNFWSNKRRFVFNELPLLKKEKYQIDQYMKVGGQWKVEMVKMTENFDQRLKVGQSLWHLGILVLLW